jgi:hypothetical protein
MRDEGFQKAFTVVVILENGFAAVAAVHDVVKGAGILDTELAGHTSRLRRVDLSVKCQ